MQNGGLRETLSIDLERVSLRSFFWVVLLLCAGLFARGIEYFDLLPWLVSVFSLFYFFHFFLMLSFTSFVVFFLILGPFSFRISIIFRSVGSVFVGLFLKAFCFHIYEMNIEVNIQRLKSV